MLKRGVALFFFCLVSSQNLTPDDEDFSTTGMLSTFLSLLESASGLSTLEPSMNIPGIGCPDFSSCTINPNGTVLWDVRADLYRKHMMQNTMDETQRETTIDGCLKYNPTDSASFNTCMMTVRLSMIEYLIIDFQSKFRSLVEEDCTLTQENCVI